MPTEHSYILNVKISNSSSYREAYEKLKLALNSAPSYITVNNVHTVVESVKKEKVFYSWASVDNDIFNKNVSDEDKLELRNKIGLRRKFTILFVGRLSNEKGIFTLLETYKNLVNDFDVSLLIIGAGPLLNEIANYNGKYELSNIFILNHIPNESLYLYYAILDILVLPSISTPILREVWGLVINEAMNQRCAIITSDIVGASRGGLIRDKENGFVFKQKATKELETLLSHLLNDENELNRFKEAAFKEIQNWTPYNTFLGFKNAIDACNH